MHQSSDNLKAENKYTLKSATPKNSKCFRGKQALFKNKQFRYACKC